MKPMNTTMLATAMDLGERIAYAGRMTLIGMVTVFAALAILWGALALFRVALAAVERRKTAKSEPAPATPAPAAPAAPTSNEEELVAAITAAVTVLLAEENGGTAPAFRVVSFRRTRGNAK